MGKQAESPPWSGYRVTADTIKRPDPPPPLQPRAASSQELIDHLRAIERLDQDVRAFSARPDASRRLLRESLAKNAYGTASIEGNPLSLEDVESLLAKSWTPQTVVEPDEREILNYAAIMDRLDQHTPPRDVADVNRLHEIYFQGVLKDPGHLKTHENFIGEAHTRSVVYIPTPAERTRDELQALLDWYHGGTGHPIVKTGLFFHEFQSIHPYLDGNGRLGRLLVTLLLHHAGYDGIRYATVDYAANQDRTTYYTALQDARRGDWDRTPWILHHTHMLHEGYSFAYDRLLLLEEAPRTLNERQLRIMEWFARITWSEKNRAVKFADVHAAFPAIPRRTLTHDLSVLTQAGALHKKGEGKGTRYHLATR